MASLPLMVATARVCPLEPWAALWHTSTLWERLQEVEPDPVLPWLSPEVSCTTMQPGVVLDLGPAKEEEDEEVL